MADVVQYCGDKPSGMIIMFLSHFFKRVELLHLDKARESESNKLFYQRINGVIEKNNLLYELYENL